MGCSTTRAPARVTAPRSGGGALPGTRRGGEGRGGYSWGRVREGKPAWEGRGRWGPSAGPAGSAAPEPPAYVQRAALPANSRPTEAPPARARRVSPPALRSERGWRRGGGSARRRPGAGGRAEQQTAPKPPQAQGSRRRRAPDSSGPAATRAFQWAARTCSTRACRSVRPRARISGCGRGAGAGRPGARGAGFVCECACPGGAARRACANCCTRVRVPIFPACSRPAQVTKGPVVLRPRL